MPSPRRSIAFAIVACMTLSSAAWAESVELSLSNQVPKGAKPSITVIAKEPVSSVEISIMRLDDKKTFVHKAGPLATGTHFQLQIGDGKLGHARWKGKLTVHAASGDSTSEVTFESSTGAAGNGMHITYDRAHLDLDNGQLQFQISRPALKAELVVLGEDGQEQARVQKDLADARAGQWIAIAWKPSTVPVLRLELTVSTDVGDTVIVKLVPWSVSIAHEEVIFPSGQAAVPPSEEKKLDASYQKIVDAVDKVRKLEPKLDVRVYVAGHTDTVGGADDNRRLSQARAKAIATWFRDRGLPLPLFFVGFGEDQLKVKTADGVDEARNRRADYVVGVEEPANGRGKFAPLR